MLSQNQICQPIKKMTERINCERCNKPNMSKKNISAHYKAGCSGIWDQYHQKKIKEPKEKKPRQPRKPRNKNISFSCSDFIDFTNWLIDNQVILDGDDEDQFHECYQLFKNNQEPPEPPMIIKITYPWTIQKSVQESVEEQVEESVEEQVEESVDQPVEESFQVGDIYPSSEEESFNDENIIQEIPTPITGPTKLKLSKLRKLKRVSDADTKGVKEKSVEQDVCNALNWSLFNHKPKIDPEDEFFLEDKNIENEFPDNTEEHIQLRLNKFMERWSDTEIKNYSNNQKKRIDHIIRKEKRELNGIIHLTNIELYKNKYQYNFILRNLINLIKVKLDQLDDEGLSQEESLKKFNQFDKNKILEKYKDKFNHWDDRARNTYELPKTCEWTITTRERPEPNDD